jgi:flagellar hook assembly protein FlgD
MLTVSVGSMGESRRFRISDDLALVDVSVFPNPFSIHTYFYYTLTQEVTWVRLAIFTVSGRKILEDDLRTFAGYNQHLWDGRDSARDLVANGTYIYKITVESAAGRREFTGRLVKLD